MITLERRIEIVNQVLQRQTLPDVEPECFILQCSDKSSDLKFQITKLAEKYKEIFILSPEFLVIPDKISNSNVTLILKPQLRTA